jgi:ketol-acid reductoisomerase
LLADDNRNLSGHFARVLHDDILSGAFAHEWSGVQAAGSDRLEQLCRKALESALAQAEAGVLRHAEE